MCLLAASQIWIFTETCKDKAHFKASNFSSSKCKLKHPRRCLVQCSELLGPSFSWISLLLLFSKTHKTHRLRIQLRDNNRTFSKAKTQMLPSPNLCRICSQILKYWATPRYSRSNRNWVNKFKIFSVSSRTKKLIQDILIKECLYKCHKVFTLLNSKRT
jgi:hypothetical protein